MVIRQLNETESDAFNSISPHILQTTYWGNFLNSIGREVDYLIGEDNGKIVKSYLNE